MSKRKLILSVLINGVLLSSLYVAGAVDVAPGSGNGVAIGTGSNAPKAENVAIGVKGSIGSAYDTICNPRVLRASTCRFNTI